MKHFISILFCLAFTGQALGDNEELFKTLLKLAQGGNAEAQYHIGMMYNNGLGREKDFKKAFEWFQKSAAGGDALGAFKVGCYYDGQAGEVVKKDAKKALEFTLKSAKAGYSLAQHHVANLLHQQGDLKEAVKYWVMAADQGFPMALYNLSASYLEGKGATKDISLAYAYFKLVKLAQEGGVNPRAQSTLDSLAAKMSGEELKRANTFVSSYKPKPSPLTIKASSGLIAAEELVKTLKE